MGLFSAANKEPRKLQVKEGIRSPSPLPSCDAFPLILLDAFVCSRVCASFAFLLILGSLQKAIKHIHIIKRCLLLQLQR